MMVLPSDQKRPLLPHTHAGELQERGVPRDLAEMNRFSELLPLTNAPGPPTKTSTSHNFAWTDALRKFWQCQTTATIISCSFVGWWPALEWSMTAEESIYSISHLIEELGVI